MGWLELGGFVEDGGFVLAGVAAMMGCPGAVVAYEGCPRALRVAGGGVFLRIGGELECGQSCDLNRPGFDGCSDAR